MIHHVKPRCQNSKILFDSVPHKPKLLFLIIQFFAFIIIYNPTMELGGVLVPSYRNRVVIFLKLVFIFWTHHHFLRLILIFWELLYFSRPSWGCLYFYSVTLFFMLSVFIEGIFISSISRVTFICWGYLTFCGQLQKWLLNFYFLVDILK